MINFDNLRALLMKVEKPSRYIGGEFGEFAAEEKPLNFCMCFPDIYEVGTSNTGIKIVAESIRRRGHGVDFCFAPASDFGEGIRALNIPLFSLAMRKPLSEFQIIGFSLSFELSYTNVLYMLDLAGIPPLREDRKGKNYPLVVLGGLCTVNPEPLADFADLIFIGDGENTPADICDLYAKYGDNLSEFYARAKEVEGVYIPELTAVSYENEKITSLSSQTRVKRAIINDLDSAIFPEQAFVCNCESVFDRAVIEVMRGCLRGCRFCQAGFVYRPVRTRSVDTLTRQACNLIKSSGFDEVSLNSLSTGDYPELRALIRSLKSNLPSDVTLALPSLRVDSFDGEFAQDARKISLTFAPEAGTQRLRDVINKDITKDEILRAASSAFDTGYSAVKLYFMLGLPTETDEDLQGIRELCDLIKSEYGRKKRAKALRISVSVSTFIPKPFTPFQWEAQCGEDEVERKQTLLKKLLYIKGVTLSWSDYFTSKLEAVLARGDRRLSKVILAAYKNGCRFDGWADKLNREGWKKAFAECQIDPDIYTRERDENEILPWDFIDVGITKKFFLDERHRAYAGAVTGSCAQGCKGCGLQKVCSVARGEK